MKFNLKNRPYFHREMNPQLVEWFEGFEKELREKIKMKQTTFDEEKLIREILAE